jgi:hypothetical protein
LQVLVAEIVSDISEELYDELTDQRKSSRSAVKVHEASNELEMHI